MFRCISTLVLATVACHFSVTRAEDPAAKDIRSAADQKRDYVNTIGMKLVYIPAGEFLMGSPPDEAGREETEFQHTVKITEPFFLGAYEVTQDEFKKVMGVNENPSWFSLAGQGREHVGNIDTSKYPVESVIWEDIVEFCHRLSAKEKKVYRLPTEAEWEYACRAGTSTPYAFGAKLTKDQARFSDESPPGMSFTSKEFRPLMRVGSYAPNQFGLYDMHGNVWELCLDWYHPDYYSRSPKEDPKGGPANSYRVIRGGGKENGAYKCRSASRSGSTTDIGSGLLGFRVAFSPSKQYKAPPPEPAPAPPDKSLVKDVRKPVEQQRDFENSIGMKFVYIPAGEFIMGFPANKDKPQEDADKRRVKITHPFFLGVYEVTQTEYQQVMGKNPSAFAASGLRYGKVEGRDTSRFPVEMVNWDRAMEFCEKLSALDGKTYRLPTEAEWEYAYRAQTTTPYYFGEKMDDNQANCSGTDITGLHLYSGKNLRRPTSVGSYLPNQFGLYDMAGNVWEWCSDWFEAEIHRESPAIDPRGPDSGRLRVTKGGSWSDKPPVCRAIFRGGVPPQHLGLGTVGFRVALSVADD